MDTFPEINWSEVARQAFMQKIEDMDFLRKFKEKRKESNKLLQWKTEKEKGCSFSFQGKIEDEGEDEHERILIDLWLEKNYRWASDWKY